MYVCFPCLLALASSRRHEHVLKASAHTIFAAGRAWLSHSTFLAMLMQCFSTSQRKVVRAKIKSRVGSQDAIRHSEESEAWGAIIVFGPIPQRRGEYQRMIDYFHRGFSCVQLCNRVPFASHHHFFHPLPPLILDVPPPPHTTLPERRPIQSGHTQKIAGTIARAFSIHPKYMGEQRERGMFARATSPRTKKLGTSRL